MGSDPKDRGEWSSHLGFILAAAGSAIGLGNIWRFPYLAGENGGAAFVVVYICCVMFIGIPVMMNEITLGRHTAKNPIGAFWKIKGKRTPWVLIGILAFIINFVVLGYYSVIAGWTIGYIYNSLFKVKIAFSTFSSTPQYVLPLYTLFIFLTIWIVAAGIEKGIERGCKIMMPMLIALILVVICRTVTLPNTYLFTWDNIPGTDNEKLINFLGQKQGIQWETEKDLGLVPKRSEGTEDQQTGKDKLKSPKIEPNKNNAICVSDMYNCITLEKVGEHTIKIAIQESNEVKEKTRTPLNNLLQEKKKDKVKERKYELVGKSENGVFCAYASPMKGLKYYLIPDWTKINVNVILAALGQAFFSLSVGWGLMIAYGSYLSKKHNIVTASVSVATADTSIALLGGFMVFPAVFAFGMSPAAGTTLTFTTLPQVFDAMFGGAIVGAMFFFVLMLAALTSSISMLEVPVAYLVDERSWSRKRASCTIGILAFLVGIPSALSLGACSWFSNITFAGEKGLLDILDYIVGSLALVLVSLLLCLFSGWAWKTQYLVDEMAESSPNFNKPRMGFINLAQVWAFFIRFVCPVIIAFLLLTKAKVF